MQRYGLIGWPIGHSFSKRFFTEKFEREGIQDARYDLFPLENIAGLPGLLAQNPALRGLNVTIPHKQAVLPFLDELDETALAVGAVNCIKVLDNHKLIGYNTDTIGFERSLDTAAWETWKKEACTALVLGTGGASKAVAYVLRKYGIPFRFVSRNPRSEQEISYQTLASSLPDSTHLQLIINTTPVGTFPNVAEMPPVPSNLFKQGMYVYDLVYNPAETLLLREAKSHGCTVKNGLSMLELQAEANWEIWQGNH